MGSVDHFFEGWKEQASVDGELGRVLGSERLVWFRDAHNLNLRIVKRMFKKSLDMPVNQTDNADPERSLIIRWRSLAMDRQGGEEREK
jgi:hypothetical protein